MQVRHTFGVRNALLAGTALGVGLMLAQIIGALMLGGVMYAWQSMVA